MLPNQSKFASYRPAYESMKSERIRNHDDVFLVSIDELVLELFVKIFSTLFMWNSVDLRLQSDLLYRLNYHVKK